jgi:hypothetical protein
MAFRFEIILPTYTKCKLFLFDFLQVSLKQSGKFLLHKQEYYKASIDLISIKGSITFMNSIIGLRYPEVIIGFELCLNWFKNLRRELILSRRLIENVIMAGSEKSFLYHFRDHFQDNLYLLRKYAVRRSFFSTDFINTNDLPINGLALCINSRQRF